MNEHEELTNTEREHMRAYLKSFMAAHPGRAPFSIRMLDWGEAMFIRNSTGTAFAYTRFAGAALALVLFVGLGTSYAAQNALPGEALYGMKVNVNEAVEGALAISPVAKAQFDADLTSRRLEEAETLAAANQLTPDVSSEIQSRIDESAASFNTNVAVLAQTPDGADQAADAQSDLEATLSAHANVLAALTATVPDTKVALAPIISSVETHVATARRARDTSGAIAIAAATTTTDSAPARADATKKQEDAQQALGKVRTLASDAEGGVSASSSAPLAHRAMQVQEVTQQGEAYLKSGDYQRASHSFQSAIRAATQTQVEAAVSLQLQKILPSLPIIEATSTVDTNDDDAPTATSTPTVAQ